MRLFQAVLLCAVVLVCASPAGVAPALAQGDSVVAQIRDRGLVRVASTRDRPLVRYLDPITNTISGFEIDIIEMITERLLGDRSKYEIIDTEFAARIPSVQQGVVDLAVVGMFITRERMEQVDFSDIYYAGGITALVPSDSPVQQMADLDGRTLIVTKATVAETAAANRFPGSPRLALDSVPLGLEALRAARGDVLIGGDDLLAGIAGTQPGFRMLSEMLTCSPTGAVIKKGQSELLDIVNQTLRDWKASGGWQQSWQRSYGQFILGAPPRPPANSRDPASVCS